MKTIRERFRAIGEGSVRFTATRQEVLDFIEQELKKERDEIIEMLEQLNPEPGAWKDALTGFKKAIKDIINSKTTLTN